MRSIIFEGDTWQRYEDLRQRRPAAHRALCRQLKEMQRGDPRIGTGKPEPLKYGLSGLWSRRLSHDDRLIYRLDTDKVGVAVDTQYRACKRLLHGGDNLFIEARDDAGVGIAGEQVFYTRGTNEGTDFSGAGFL